MWWDQHIYSNRTDYTRATWRYKNHSSFLGTSSRSKEIFICVFFWQHKFTHVEPFSLKNFIYIYRLWPSRSYHLFTYFSLKRLRIILNIFFIGFHAMSTTTPKHHSIHWSMPFTSLFRHRDCTNGKLTGNLGEETIWKRSNPSSIRITPSRFYSWSIHHLQNCFSGKPRVDWLG